jgi:hypothetical protein
VSRPPHPAVTTSCSASTPPRWPAAAQRLVSALAAHPDASARSRLLERVALRFGPGRYLGFVQLLCAVEQFGDAAARRIVADALAGAIASSRVPSGTAPAWGAASFSLSAKPQSAGAPPGTGGHRLGPIEFVSAALLQPGISPHADNPEAEFPLLGLLGLLNASPQVAALYATRLQAHAGDPLEGGLSPRTRSMLGAMATHWKAGAPPERVVRCALAARCDQTIGVVGRSVAPTAVVL